MNITVNPEEVVLGRKEEEVECVGHRINEQAQNFTGK